MGISRGLSVEAINHINVVLIPKVKDVRSTTEFQPISLCNVIYKISIKMISNKLKWVLSNVISENQSAFVPHHLIFHNTIFAFELMHSLRKQNNGNRG